MTQSTFSVEDFEPMPDAGTALDTAHRLLDVPVGWSERSEGFWVVSGREQCLAVLQDKDGFEVGGVEAGGLERAVRIPADPPGFVRPLMPPQDANPPLHRNFRQLINPHLSPQALARHEPSFRDTIGGLVRSFAPSGHADVVHDLGSVFPATITFRDLFGIDDEDELAQVHRWVSGIVYGRHRGDADELTGMQDAWNRWTDEVIARRKITRRDDVLDALLFGTVGAGRVLRHDEIAGAIQVLTLGGFMTTSDATCNLVVALIEHPGLETTLRDHPELVPRFVEEVLRLEPPVSTRARRCVRDTEIGGHAIRASERVMVNLLSANRDPSEYEQPDELDLDRPHNRHLAFGGGIHRCVGSTLARMTLRMVVEQLLEHTTDLRYADDDGARRLCVSGATWRLVTSLPVTFTPR